MNRYDCPDPLGELLLQIQKLGEEEDTTAKLLVLGLVLLVICILLSIKFIAFLVQ
jgi:hypothetical protein